MILYDSVSPKLVAHRSRFDWGVLITERVAYSTIESFTTVADAVFGTTDASTVVLREAELISALITPATYESLDPSIAVMVGNRAQWVSDGTARVLLKLGGHTKRFMLPVSREENATGVSVFSSWVPGCASEHITNNVDSRLQGLSPTAATLDIFSVVNHAAQSYTRNPNVWCADYHQALTGCNVWQTDYIQGRAQTAITRRHVVGAAHYGNPMRIGDTIRFVAADGTVVNRTAIQTRHVIDRDIQLTVLSSDLPLSITPVSLLPANQKEYLFSTAREGLAGLPRVGVPCLLRNQFGEARVSDVGYIGPYGVVFYIAPPPAHRADWDRQLVVGDSGGPALLMINGKLVLIVTWTGAGNGPSYLTKNWTAEIAISDALAGISTGYTPDVVDLSGFTNFS